MEKRKKVLWLVSWYPNKYDWFDGDFVQRHAKAAALYNDIHVLFIKQSEEKLGDEQVVNHDDGLTEQIIYLPKKRGTIGKLRSLLHWRDVFQREAALFIKNHQPALVHVHVPWKAGLIALWLRRRYKIPYVVTEHWDIYNHVVGDNIYTKSFLFRFLLKQVYKQASGLISVSRFLANEINHLTGKIAYKVIPNAVDTAIFSLGHRGGQQFTFLHVSNMADKKNVAGILSAFQQFLEQSKADAQLILVGNKDHQYVHQAQDLQLLDKAVFFRGEIPYADVAKEMQQAHVFVLNSDMENSPCVIGEALCCGLPVIATRVGGIPELVNEQNSLLIPPRNMQALAEAFRRVYETYSQYNAGEIASEAKRRFSYATVGEQLHQLYWQ